MRNFIKANGTKTSDFGTRRDRGVTKGNDGLRALVFARHLMQRHAYWLPASLLVALERLAGSVRRSAVSRPEPFGSGVADPQAAWQPVCCLPCSSPAIG